MEKSGTALKATRQLLHNAAMVQHYCLPHERMLKRMDVDGFGGDRTLLKFTLTRKIYNDRSHGNSQVYDRVIYRWNIFIQLRVSKIIYDVFSLFWLKSHSTYCSPEYYNFVKFQNYKPSNKH